MATKSKYFSTLKEAFLLEETKPGESTEYILDVLVDADALVALVKTNEPNHKRAISISEALQKMGCTWYISPFTIGEVITVISHKVNQITAKKVLKELRRQNLNILVLKDEYLHLADNWFNKQNKKGTSYFDCYNMALLERYKNQLNTIFSFDSVYKRNGFKLAEEII
ncbi:MAG: PIN domain-containing protein [Candidatus Levybacteria bacterium]|nr:PIN domain-containing protein [Candidatus Levybacteria bacterium]